MFEIIGIIGASTVLATFAFNQFDLLSPKTLLYDVLNFVASVCLVVYAIYSDVIPFMVINTIWGAVSLYDILFRDNLKSTVFRLFNKRQRGQ